MTAVVETGVTTDRRRQKLIVIALLIGVAATSFPTTLLAASLEKIRLDFRAEAFNLFNRVRFGNGGTNLDSTNFGEIGRAHV